MEEYLLDPQLAALLPTGLDPNDFQIIFGNITALRDFHKGFALNFLISRIAHTTINIHLF